MDWNRCSDWSGICSGNASGGPRLKKSPAARANHRLHRRKRAERTAASRPDVGSAGTDAGAAISLQLAHALGYGGSDLVEFLFSAVSGHHSQSAGGGVPHASAAPSFRECLGDLGWSPGTPKPIGAGVCGGTTRAAAGGVFAGVCAGTQPRGISVGVLETSCVAESVSPDGGRIKLPCPASLATHEASAAAGSRILETSRSL